MKKIACYKINDLDVARLSKVLKQMEIELVLLDDGMLRMTLEEVLQQPDLARHQDCLRFVESFMILQDVSDEELTQLIQQGKVESWTFQPIKMMVTQHNQSWKLMDLFSEVMKEHQLFAKAGLLQECLRQPDPSKETQSQPTKLAQYNEILMKGYMLLKSGQFDEKSLDEMIALIKQYQ